MNADVSITIFKQTVHYDNYYKKNYKSMKYSILFLNQSVIVLILCYNMKLEKKYHQNLIKSKPDINMLFSEIHT